MHAPLISPLAGWQIYLRVHVRPKSTVSLPGQQKANKTARKLNAKRDAPIVAAIMEVLGAGRSSKFEYEGAARHGLRSGFCLDGLPWAKADMRACAIVTEALRRIGAARPTWVEAQGDLARGAIPLTDHFFCQRCGAQLPDDARQGTKYCSRTCKDAAASAFRWHLTKFEGEAGMKATMAARVAARRKGIRKFTCEGCGIEFERKWKPQGYRFCSRNCSAKHNKYVLDPRVCVVCGGEFTPTRAPSKVCSISCRERFRKQYEAARKVAPPERPCAVCGRPFCPAKRDALYCSHACNCTAYRARQRGGMAEFRCEAAE